MNSPEIEVASLASEKYVYTTKEICPEPAVTWKGYEEDGQDLVLEAGADFKYVYGSNINAGTGTVKIVPANGNNNFRVVRNIRLRLSRRTSKTTT